MYWLVGLMTLSLLGIVVLGVLLELGYSPKMSFSPNHLKGVLAINVLTFIMAGIGLVLFAVQEALAAPVAEGTREISLGMGLAFIGAGIPTAVAAIGAGIAVGPVGAAALAAIADKPAAFGRSLVYLGLAEGIAIYGVVVSILILGRIG